MSFKEQLKNEILPKAVDYYNSGMDINASVVKAAQDFSLNLDQTDRLLETMNTARVIAHYEKHAEDRTSNCDIAEKEIVHKLLFRDDDPATEKKASCTDSFSDVDYLAYYEKERNYRVKNQPLTKAAECTTKPKSTDGFSRKQLVDQLSEYGKTFTYQRKFAEDQKGLAEELLLQSVEKVASSLSKGYDPEERYALFKVACSKSYPDALARIESIMPEDIVKNSANSMKKLARMNVLDTRDVGSELALAKDIHDGIDAIGRIDKMIETFGNREKQASAALRKEARTFGGNPNGGSGGGGGGNRGGNNNSNGNNNDDRDNDPWVGKSLKKTYDIAKSVGKGVIPSWSPGIKAIDDYIHGGALTAESISDSLKPDKTKKTTLRDYIDNVRRSDIITELYHDDPIISEADKNDVLQAYETLVQTAPEASLNKEVVRAILRQSVNSVAVSPFDAKQWADLDNVELKNKFILAHKDRDPISSRA